MYRTLKKWTTIWTNKDAIFNQENIKCHENPCNVISFGCWVINRSRTNNVIMHWKCSNKETHSKHIPAVSALSFHIILSNKKILTNGFFLKGGKQAKQSSTPLLMHTQQEQWGSNIAHNQNVISRVTECFMNLNIRAEWTLEWVYHKYMLQHEWLLFQFLMRKELLGSDILHAWKP